MSPAYPIIMGTALLTGYLLSRSSQQNLGITPLQRLGILAGAFCGAILAAKLPFLFSDWDAFVSGIAWFQNGKTILCGLAGGYFGVEIAKWTFDVKTKTGDSFVVPVAASVAIGRIACFSAGCCYGTPTHLPWGVVFPTADALPRHPTQLYETLFHGTCAILFWWLRERGVFRGNLIKVYIIAYCIYRLATELIRPEARLLGGLTGYQWGSLFLIVVFAGLWYRDRHQSFGAANLSAENN